MATARGRQSIDLIAELAKSPYRFEFFQAARLLERAAALAEPERQLAHAPVAKEALPNAEFVKFRARPSLSFAAADVSKVSLAELPEQSDAKLAANQWEMEVTFMGLFGSQSVLPQHLAELVVAEMRQKSTVLRDYLDLFNHRTVSLFYESWHKYQLPANYERNKQNNHNQPDSFTHALLSLAGLGTSELQYRQAIPDEALAGLAGLLSRPVCTAETIQNMVKTFFGLSVEVRQFQGKWQPLHPEVQCQLGGSGFRGINNQLGVSAVIGQESFQAQSKFTVVLSPDDSDAFMDMAPGSPALEALKASIRYCAGVEMDFDIEVNLPEADVPPAQLQEEDDYQPLLGWNTLLPGTGESDDAIAVRLSQHIAAPDEGLPLAS